MRTLLVLPIAVALLMVVTLGDAQNKANRPRERAKDLISKLDTDKDGVVAKAEFEGDAWMFDQLDKNKDGKLNVRELADKKQQADRPAAGQHAKAMFDKADKNGDGKLSLQEFMDQGFARRDGNKNMAGMDRPAKGPGPGDKARVRERAGEQSGDMARERKGGPGGEMRGAKYDADGDGALSKEEFAAMQADTFKKLDKNADGFLTPDEMPAPRGPMAGPGRQGGEMRMGPRFKQMDTDGDGKIAKAEWKGQEQAFIRLDRNADGYIDQMELPKGPMGGQGRMGPGGQQGQGGRMGVLERIKQMDTDGDGKLVRDEWTGRPEVFDRLDRNADGYIDQSDRGQQ